MKKCDVCGKEAKARSIELLKPQSEWTLGNYKEHEFIDLCYECSSSVLWHLRMQAIQYAENNKQYKGVTNAEIKSLLNDNNSNCGCDDK